MNNLGKTKKNWVVKMAVLGVTATLLTGGLVAGTMAKYVAKVKGSDTARVAKFVYEAAATNAKGERAVLSSTSDQDINLFAYRNDTGMIGGTGSIDGKQVVAPGTSGSVAIDISNSSEVAVSSTLVVTEANKKKIPIIYKYGSEYYTSMLKGYVIEPGDAVKVKLHEGDAEMVVLKPENTFSELTKKLEEPRTLNPITSAESKISATQLEVEWFWPYEMYVGTLGDGTGSLLEVGVLGDEWDSGLGAAGNAEVIINIEAEFKQLDEIK